MAEGVTLCCAYARYRAREERGFTGTCNPGCSPAAGEVSICSPPRTAPPDARLTVLSSPVGSGGPGFDFRTVAFILRSITCPSKHLPSNSGIR